MINSQEAIFKRAAESNATATNYVILLISNA